MNTIKSFFQKGYCYMENLEDSVFDIDIAEFEDDGMDLDDLDFGFETEQKRYINPGRKQIVSKPVKYRNAMQLAKQIGDIEAEDRYFIFLDGNFVYGDFIEAWIIHNQWNVLEMTISTLSMSENNVDSLKTLMVKDYLQELNLIVSDYFFTHERHNLIPYLYKELDEDNKLQLSVARVHTKICLIRTECGKRIILHGSANLRTSKNVEQLVIECDRELYDFNESWHKEIIEKYKTINKTVGAKDLWQADQKNGNMSMKREKRQHSKRPGQKQARQKPQPDPNKGYHSKAW